MTGIDRIRRHLEISSPAEAIAAIPALIGFTPSPGDLIVLGFGPGVPQCRTDLNVDPAGLRIALSGAWSAWRKGRIFVAAYSPTPVELDLEYLFPGIEVIDAVRVHNQLIWSPSEETLLGVCEEPLALPDTPAPLPSRDSLVQAAEMVTDVEAAMEEGISAWQNGNGALAWILLDRARALNVPRTDSEQMIRLEVTLRSCVNPREVTLDETGLPAVTAVGSLESK